MAPWPFYIIAIPGVDGTPSEAFRITCIGFSVLSCLGIAFPHLHGPCVRIAMIWNSMASWLISGYWCADAVVWVIFMTVEHAFQVVGLKLLCQGPGTTWHVVFTFVGSAGGYICSQYHDLTSISGRRLEPSTISYSTDDFIIAIVVMVAALIAGMLCIGGGREFLVRLRSWKSRQRGAQTKLAPIVVNAPATVDDEDDPAKELQAELDGLALPGHVVTELELGQAGSDEMRAPGLASQTNRAKGQEVASSGDLVPTPAVAGSPEDLDVPQADSWFDCGPGTASDVEFDAASVLEAPHPESLPAEGSAALQEQMPQESLMWARGSQVAPDVCTSGEVETAPAVAWRSEAEGMPSRSDTLLSKLSVWTSEASLQYSTGTCDSACNVQEAVWQDPEMSPCYPKLSDFGSQTSWTAVVCVRCTACSLPPVGPNPLVGTWRMCPCDPDAASWMLTLSIDKHLRITTADGFRRELRMQPDRTALFGGSVILVHEGVLYYISESSGKLARYEDASGLKAVFCSEKEQECCTPARPRFDPFHPQGSAAVFTDTGTQTECRWDAECLCGADTSALSIVGLEGAWKSSSKRVERWLRSLRFRGEYVHDGVGTRHRLELKHGVMKFNNATLQLADNKLIVKTARGTVFFTRVEH
eukprot:CAMPEP_0197877742 /NCGR_PEP_ID=MMETSP1439-20131203/6344_1 /TAXON_ID=66791 /ORGANISM="Gonyaulax spinifera, Strain CCMP409" /LENGTH=642 /DNA_ID=CAMNT_0043497113 /DNA_START=114 /DNA_END=2042 /DNA_ORIENTATION=-